MPLAKTTVQIRNGFKRQSRLTQSLEISLLSWIKFWEVSWQYWTPLYPVGPLIPGQFPLARGRGFCISTEIAHHFQLAFMSFNLLHSLLGLASKLSHEWTSAYSQESLKFLQSLFGKVLISRSSWVLSLIIWTTLYLPWYWWSGIFQGCSQKWPGEINIGQQKPKRRYMFKVNALNNSNTTTLHVSFKK